MSTILKALKGTQKPAKTTASAPARKRRKVNQSVAKTVKLLATISTLRGGLAQITAAAESFADARRAIDLLKRHGASAPVMELLNPADDPAGIDGLPSAESLDGVPLAVNDPVNLRAIQLISAALENEGEMVKDWVETTADGLGSALDSLREQVGEFTQSIADLRQYVDGATIDEQKLGAVTVTTISAADRLEVFEKLKGVVEQLDVPNYDVNDAEGVAKLHEQIAAIVGEIKAFTGATYSGDGVVATNAEEIDAQFQATEGTLAEKGYTAEACTSILDAAGALLGALQALADKQAALGERLKNTAQEVVVDAQADAGGEGDKPAQENEGEEPPAEGGESGTGDNAGGEGGEAGNGGGEGDAGTGDNGEGGEGGEGTEEDPLGPLTPADNPMADDPGTGEGAGEGENGEGEGGGEGGEGDGTGEPAPNPEEPPADGDKQGDDATPGPAQENEEGAPVAVHREALSGWTAVVLLVVEAAVGATSDALAVIDEVAEVNGATEADPAPAGGEGGEGEAGGAGDGDTPPADVAAPEPDTLDDDVL